MLWLDYSLTVYFLIFFADLEPAQNGECPLQCPHCSSAYVELVTLKEHIASQHGDVVKTLNSSCLQCGATFQNKEELEKHVTLHCPVTQECKVGCICVVITLYSINHIYMYM